MNEDADALRAQVARLESMLCALQPLVNLATVQPVTVAEWSRAVTAIYASRRPSTRYRTKQALGLVAELVGAESPTSVIDAALVARIVASRPAWRAAYINGVLRALRAAVRIGQAKSRRWIGPDAVEGARWVVPEVEAPLVRLHSCEDVARVLAYLRNRSSDWRGLRLYALASVYAYTGVRAKEAQFAKVADLNMGASVLWVWPNGRPLKTEASRDAVPVCEELRPVLERWVNEVRSEWLFPTLDRKGPWHTGTRGYRPVDQLKAAGLACGVEGFTAQSLRHAAATHLITRFGFTKEQVRMLLRHTNLRTQERYVHPEVINLGAAMRGFAYRLGA